MKIKIKQKDNRIDVLESKVKKLEGKINQIDILSTYRCCDWNWFSFEFKIQLTEIGIWRSVKLNWNSNFSHLNFKFRQLIKLDFSHMIYDLATQKIIFHKVYFDLTFIFFCTHNAHHYYQFFFKKLTYQKIMLLMLLIWHLWLHLFIPFIIKDF